MSTLALSPIVAGCWRLLEWELRGPALVRWIEQALALGITSFDHADVYGDHRAEAAFGEALRAAPGLRERLQLVTKCGIRLVSPARPEHRVKSYDSTRAHLVASVERSLRAFATDHLDLLLVHRPDLLMEPDELAETFRLLQRSGKVLELGLSNHSASQFLLLQRRFPALATHQVEFSPLSLGALADGTLEQALDLRIAPMAWSPLAGGRLLTGRDESARRVRAELEDQGRAHGVSAATMAYAWIRRHPARPIPITGTGRVERLREAVAALEVRMTAEDWYRVHEASMGREVA
jgi:predicted oxidoreductase